MTDILDHVRGPLIVLAGLVAGLQAGTYFTWATGVMPGLARVDDRTFVSTMQEVNVAIVNPVFLAHVRRRAPARRRRDPRCAGRDARPWAIAATVLAVGTVVITAAGNVPLNDALAAAGPVDAIKDLAQVAGRLRVAVGEAQRRPHAHLGRRRRRAGDGCAERRAA